MNDLGIHALVWAGDTSETSVERAILQTKLAGYDLLEFSLHDGFQSDPRKAGAALRAAGLGVACSRGLALDADVSSEDPAVVQKGSELIAESIETTQQLGGKTLTGALYGAFGKASAPLSSRGRANLVAALRESAQGAADLGVSLGLEVCNRYETNVINTAADALRLADEIGHDNVFVHLDVYHMNIEETDFVRPVQLVGQRLGYVHIGENHRGYLGSGHIDLPSFFRALADIDYAGPITFESFSSAVVMESLSTDLAIWRNLWSDGPALARHALQTMRGLIEAATPR